MSSWRVNLDRFPPSHARAPQTCSLGLLCRITPQWNDVVCTIYKNDMGLTPILAS